MATLVDPPHDPSTAPPPGVPGEVPADFLADTDLCPDPAVAGRFGIDVSPAWNVIYTFGGMSFGLALRGAERALARDDLALVSAHAVFCEPVAAGPVVVDTTVLRQGRAAAQVHADLRVGAPPADARSTTPNVALSAVFGRVDDSPVDFTGIEFPDDVLEPEASPRPSETSEDSPFGRIRFHDQVEWRIATPGFDPRATDRAPGPARAQVWMRFLDEPRRPDGTLDPVALAVPADTLGWALFRRTGTSLPPFLVLTLELDLQVLAPTRSRWLLQDVRCQHAGGGFAFGTVELWDEDRRLVAMASQRARLRLFDPGAAPAADQG